MKIIYLGKLFTWESSLVWTSFAIGPGERAEEKPCQFLHWSPH